MQPSCDAIVVGSGPNGLAAAVTLAREGLRVLVLEANDQAGGGLRSDALTLPGFVHDVCSSIHPLALGSPFFRSLNLDVQWIQPELAVAHPLDGGRAAWLSRSIPASTESFAGDAASYRRMIGPLADKWEPLIQELLQPILHLPRKPLLLGRFGMLALRSAAGLARRHFETDEARALFAGLAGHSFLPLEEAGSAAVGLVLAVLAHGAGWPMPRGGTGKICEALVSVLRASGGEIETGHRVNNIDELPPARAILFDVPPRQLLAIAGHRFPPGYRAALENYRYGPGVFKIDYALSSPIPWTARGVPPRGDGPCRRDVGGDPTVRAAGGQRSRARTTVCPGRAAQFV